MSAETPSQQQPARAVVVPGTPMPAERGGQEIREAVASPAKVMRIGAMVRQLLEEVQRAPLDDAGRVRMGEIYDTSVRELAEVLSPDLAEELARFALPLDSDNDTPTEAELRVAQAQLVGWLEGLFHGIQASLFAQQMAARNQLAEMRGRQLMPPGQPREDDRDGSIGSNAYL